MVVGRVLSWGEQWARGRCVFAHQLQNDNQLTIVKSNKYLNFVVIAQFQYLFKLLRCVHPGKATMNHVQKYFGLYSI